MSQSGYHLRLVQYMSSMSKNLLKLNIKSRINVSQEAEMMVRLHKQTVFAICLANTGSIHDAEDITQDVFLKAFNRLNRLGNPKHTRAWLIKIARHSCISHYRKKRPAVSATLDETPAAKSDSNPQVDQLHTALCKLSDDYRETLSLYYLNGRNCANIATAFAISEAAVRQRLVRGRLMLHDILKEDKL